MTDEPLSPSSPILAMLQASRKFVENEHPLFKQLDLRPLQLNQGEVRFAVTMPELFADGEYAHGGAVTVMLDTILGYAVWTTLETFRPIATINLKTDYLGEITPDTRLVCTGTCEGIYNEVAYCTGKAETEADNRLIARASGTFMVGTRSGKGSSRL